jgi:multidrug efflux system outer membrane protein
MKRRQQILIYLIGGFFLSVSSCTLYQTPAVPPVKIADQFKYAPKITHANLKDHWWENFNDGRLNQLVTVALKNNNNYQIALKNIDIAKTYVTQNQSGLFPQANLNLNLSRNKPANVFNTNTITAGTNALTSGKTLNVVQPFASVSYELDVWNQIGNAVDQSKSNVAASQADSNIIKLMLISNIAHTYFQIQALNATHLNLKKQAQTIEELLQLNATQYHGQLIDVSSVDDAKTRMETIKIAIENTEKQKEIFVNMLAYLLGLSPEQFSFNNDSTLTRVNYAHLIPAGIPSKMIANRPDIQSAYFQVLSYGYAEKQNIANFLPSFNLTGNYGYAHTSFSKLFTQNNIYWSYGLNFLQPLFDYQLRMSEYKRSKYQYEAAILNYKNAIVNAFQEVNNALVSYQKDNEALRADNNKIINAKEKLSVSQAQYQSGYGDYFTYLNDQLALLENEDALNNQRLVVCQDVIQVYKTLGLGL